MSWVRFPPPPPIEEFLPGVILDFVREISRKVRGVDSGKVPTATLEALWFFYN